MFTTTISNDFCEYVTFKCILEKVPHCNNLIDIYQKGNNRIEILVAIMSLLTFHLPLFLPLAGCPARCVDFMNSSAFIHK